MATTYDAGTQRLINDLMERPESFSREELLGRVRKLRFHDHQSPHGTPKLLLVQQLTEAGYEDLASLCRGGRYDQDAEEARKWANPVGGCGMIGGVARPKRTPRPKLFRCHAPGCAYRAWRAGPCPVCYAKDKTLVALVFDARAR